MTAPHTLPNADAVGELENRLDRLEELTFFQEETIGRLNEELAAHQAQLTAQERRMELLETRLAELWDGLNRGELTVPPHYL